VEDHVGIGVPFQRDDDPYRFFPVGFVVYVGYPVYPFFLDKVGDPFDEPRLIDLVREILYYYPLPVVLVGLYFRLCPYDEPAPACPEVIPDALPADDRSGGREIRAFYDPVQF